MKTLAVTKSKAREDFAKKRTDGRPGIDAAVVEAELVKIGAELATPKPDGDDKSAKKKKKAKPHLVDASHIARPERFITPEVSGVTIPLVVLAGGGEDPDHVRGQPVEQHQQLPDSGL